MMILYVEDDHLVAEPILARLKKEFPQAEIKWIGSESEFYSSFEKIADSPPDVIIIDVMTLWDIPSRKMTPPPINVEQEGFHRAGIRCAKKLAADYRTQKVPVILYTVLDSKEFRGDIEMLPSHHYYLSKEPDVSPLILKVKEFLNL